MRTKCHSVVRSFNHSIIRLFDYSIIVLSLALPAAAEEVDGIAARVGTEVILRSDIFDELRRMGAPNDKYEDIREELIDRKLILRAAAEAKMTMQEWVVESRIREIIKKGFDGDRNKLMDTLTRQKVSYPEWRARMKEDMVVSAMRYQVVDKNVSASPADLRKEYREHKSRYSDDSKVTVSVIALQPSEAAKRDKIAAQVKTEPFEALGAQRFVNVKPEDQFNPEICAEIAKMPKGTISRWIEVRGWNYLIRKEDETVGHIRPFEDAIDDVEANVKEEVAKRMYKAWLKRLRDETFVKVY